MYQKIREISISYVSFAIYSWCKMLNYEFYLRNSILMQQVQGFDKLPLRPNKSVVTIGNFDGVHLGHRQILSYLQQQATQKRLSSCVITFDPHPSHVIASKNKVERLFSIDDLRDQLKSFNVELLIVQPFTEEFSNVTAENFISQFVVNKLHPEEIVVGYDFVFGKNRAGDFKLLEKMASDLQYQAVHIPAVLVDGEIVSSSKIRQLVKDGHIEKARIFLQRPYYIQGRVVHGEGRGEKLGFATANLECNSMLVPQEGVYVTQLESTHGLQPALTNIGHKPTFHENFELSIETYVLNSKENYYDQNVKVHFFKRVRPELKFTQAQDLIAQIQQDVLVAKNFFGM